MLEKILKRNYTKIIIGVVIMFVLFMQTTFAADNEVLGMGVNQLQKLLKFLLEIGFFLAGIISALVGWFMTADWTTGVIFGLDEIFKELWVLISNLVYFVFAFLLIAIAFMNIIGKGGENFALKTALPKFIIGVLIVPFTWFIVQFFISLSTVMTVSILALPADIISSNELMQINPNVKIPANGCTIDLDKIDSDDFLVCDDKETPLNATQFLEKQPFGILYSYLYGVFNFQELLKLDTSSWFQGAVSAADIIVKIFFNFVFFIAFLLILFTLFIALFVRTVYLWIYTIFSPIFGLTFFFGGEGGGEMMKKFNFKEFISLIMVPVYVAAALSFGLLFISILSTNHKYEDQTVVPVTENGKTTVNLKPFALTIIGDIFPDSKSGPNPFSRFIMYMVGLGVLWMSTMAAFKSSEITEAAAKPMIGLGEDIGNLMKSAPKYIPLPGVGLDMAGLSQTAKYPERTLNKISAGKSSKYVTKIREAMGVKEVISTSELQNLKEQLKITYNPEELKEILMQLNKYTKAYGRDNPQIKQMEKDFFAILERRNKAGELKFARLAGFSPYLDLKSELVDKETGELTDAAFATIIQSTDQSEIRTYRNNKNGDGTKIEEGAEMIKIKTWNNKADIKIIVGSRDTLTKEDINGEYLRLVQPMRNGAPTEQVKIQYFTDGNITGESFTKGVTLDDITNLDSLKIKEEQVKFLEELRNKGIFSIQEISKITEEIFGKGVTADKLESAIKERRTLEREAKYKQEDDDE